jgi:hypothetical protein
VSNCSKTFFSFPPFFSPQISAFLRYEQVPLNKTVIHLYDRFFFLHNPKRVATGYLYFILFWPLA